MAFIRIGPMIKKLYRSTQLEVLLQTTVWRRISEEDREAWAEKWGTWQELVVCSREGRGRKDSFPTREWIASEMAGHFVLLPYFLLEMIKVSCQGIHFIRSFSDEGGWMVSDEKKDRQTLALSRQPDSRWSTRRAEHRFWTTDQTLSQEEVSCKVMKFRIYSNSWDFSSGFLILGRLILFNLIQKLNSPRYRSWQHKDSYQCSLFWQIYVSG